MYKNIFKFFIFCFSLVLFTTNVNAEIYTVTPDNLSISGALSYSCINDYTSNDCANSKPYGVAPNTTSSLFNVALVTYTQGRSGSNPNPYTYDNVPDLINYYYYSVDRAKYKFSTGFDYGPFFVGPGLYPNGTGYNDVQVESNLSYVNVGLCVSKNVDWKIDSFYLPSAYYQIKLVGLYTVNSNTGLYTWATPESDTTDCRLAIDDNNDGVVDLYLDGYQVVLIYSTTGYGFSHDAVGSFESRFFVTFKNFGSTPLYVSFIGLGPRRNVTRLTSTNESQYLESYEWNSQNQLLYDFWQSQVIDQQNIQDLLTDESPANFNQFLNNWNSSLIQNSQVTSMLNIPLTLYNALHNGLINTCRDYTIDLPIFNSNYQLVLPCSVNLARILGNVVSDLIGAILSAFMLFRFFNFVIIWWNNTVTLRDNLSYFLDTNYTNKEDDF